MPELQSPSMLATQVQLAADAGCGCASVTATCPIKQQLSGNESFMTLPPLAVKRPTAKALFAPVHAFLQAALGGRAVATTGGMPLPDDIRPIMDDPAAYLDAFKRFSACTTEYETINPKVEEVMAALAGRRADGRIRVLDIGAGFGWLPTVPCFGRYVKSYTAVEPNEVMRPHIFAAAKAAGLTPDVDARVVSDFFTPSTTVGQLAAAGQSADEGFDMVLFSHSLYYFAPAEAAAAVFHALQGLTKADGRVMVIHQAREVMPIVDAMSVQAAAEKESKQRTSTTTDSAEALSELIEEVVLVDGRVSIRRGTADEAAVLQILTNFCLEGAEAGVVAAAHNVLRENYVVRVNPEDGSECVLNTGVVVVLGRRSGAQE